MAPKRKRAEVNKIFDNENENDDDDTEVTFKTPKLDLASPSLEKEDEEPRRSPNGFILPDPLPEGHVLVDNVGRSWVIGKSIGLGGFGEIYAARSSENEAGKEDCVVKVEPHNNGPLFAEIAFYLKSGKLEQVQSWKEDNDLDHLGVPHFIASGSLSFNAKRFRFLVLPRYGKDLQSIVDSPRRSIFFARNNKAFSIAIQVVNALEYIHSRGYVHKDVKGSNLLLGRKSRSRVFLVDFGLCSKYVHHDLHKPHIPDPRLAHEGTMEYTSRDAHSGCFSRRGDVEILLYNLVEWLGGKLPWEDMLDVEPEVIAAEKAKAFQDVEVFLAACKVPPSCHREVLRDLFSMVDSLGFEERPDYDEIRRLLGEKKKVLPNMMLRFGKVVQGPEKLARVDRKKKKSMGSYEEMRREIFRRQSELSLRNPTPAMTEQLERMRSRSVERRATKQWRNLEPSPLTPAMEAVVAMQKLKKEDEECSNILQRKSARRTRATRNTD